ncbi:huntingtin [Euwallacea fornicatus]|uniref:huntingtin n=1 Tax=Euwallacea fornicatus TaxID=995702 RepID=UPI00338D6C53
MASLERLQKSLDILKTLSNNRQPPDQAKKREKVQHCYLVAEAFSNPTIKICPNISLLLEITIETFLKLCDDTDSDVRMTSDECLNRIIRAVSDGHTTKVQIELLNEIKRNGSPRSLRAAILRFSQLVHYIKPHKGKPYVLNLFPKLVTIADRTEESIHDTLSNCLPNIFKSLLIFTSENDLKALLKAFLQNVVKPSATIRRASSSCILSICTYSRRPSFFVAYCINYLLDIIIPIDSNHSSWVILGTFHCLKGLLVYVNKEDLDSQRSEGLDIPKGVGEGTQVLRVNRLMQIYELCLYYLNTDDHNIVNASLDTLSILLSNATKELQCKLTNPMGINFCRIHKSLSISNVRSPSQLSVAPSGTLSDDHHFQECDLTETIESDIETWIGQSKLSVLNMPSLSQGIDKLDLSDSVESTGETLVHHYDRPERLAENLSLKSSSFNENLDAFSDRLSEKSEAVSEDKVLDDQIDYFEVEIGDNLNKSMPLLYCTRLLAKLFLLTGTPGQCLNDKTVRVSVKASALTCMSSIFQLCPYAFFIYLDKNYTPLKSDASRISSQRITDVVLLKDHSDPQIRGLIGFIVSTVLVAVMRKTNFDYSLWGKLLEENLMGIHTYSGSSDVNNFVRVWVKGLQDENANCLRQTLLCLKPALHLISQSSNCQAVLPILNILPTLANNPYWLVKVALCELVSDLSYLTMYHITGSNLFQQKVFCNVLLKLLNDPDQRVRSSASSAILNMAEQLYCEDYHPSEIVATTKGIYCNRQYLPDMWDKKSEENIYKNIFVENMPFPYSALVAGVSVSVDYSLSKIVTKLYVLLLESTDKYLVYGCIEALAALSNKYPCTTYRLAWGIADGNSNSSDLSTMDCSKDLLNLCVSLLLFSMRVYDISFLTNLMILTFNLYAGFATSLIRQTDLTEQPLKNWSMFPSESLRSLSDQYLLHTMKLLNIFHHVINDIVPVSPQSKTVLQHLPSAGTLSPIKRRKSEDKKLTALGHSKNIDKDEVKGERKLPSFGHFSASQHYVRIYETLRSAFVNYKISLDPASSESFRELMRVTVHTLCVIMEVGTLNEFGRIAEEILTYMKTTFQLDKTLTVKCVQQLLKCLFDTNLTAHFGEVLDKKPLTGDKEEDHTFYENVFHKPCEALSSWIQSLSNISKVECDGDDTLMGYLHRKGVKKLTATSKSLDKTLASYIRIFEPIVINSLKQYTITSDVLFQCQVLHLLCQLMQLRINYCLLDSDQVFKDYVLKQFEYIEEGLVPHSEEIIPRIFHFLVNLSYSKQHSKSIIDIPKIIQLCDGLMASGQDPETHCIPALEPIVEDVFLFRSRTNTTDVKELETTREVILSMLLRLLEYPAVIDLVTLILEDSKYCTDDTEKWLRWSGQVASVFLNLLGQDKVRINNAEHFISLRKLIFALNPNVFRPVDDVLVMLFQAPPATRDELSLGKWLSKVIILMFLISPLKEEELLQKINSIKAEFNPGSILENFVATADPLNVYNNADAFRNLEAEAIVSRLILRIINLVSGLLEETGPNCDEFLVSQLGVFLMYCSLIFQTGSLCKVSQHTAFLLNQSTNIGIETTNDNFVKMRKTYPSLTFHYCHVLSVLNYGSLDFWNRIFGSPSASINDLLVQIGGTIVFCDYLNENISETKQLSWILSNHPDKLVNLIDELPVSEFVSFVHRNSTLSKVFVAGISQYCLKNPDPVFKTKILKCIEDSHTSQTGASVKLLIPNLLFNKQSAVSRFVVRLASRKIEYLLTMSTQEVLEQLSKNDLFIIKEELSIRMMAKKYETLISLLNKLLVRHYDMSPLDVGQTHILKPESIRKLEIDKKWLLSQIQAKYHDGMLRKETSKVMTKLEHNELSAFVSSDDFNKVILRDCIERGVKMMREEDRGEEPPVLKTAVDRVLKEVSRMINEICCNHEIFSMENDEPTNKYTSEIIQSFENSSFAPLLQDMSFSLSSFMKHLSRFPTLELSEIDSENISKFAVLALEYVHYILSKDSHNFDVGLLELLLDCSDKILKQSQFCSYLGVDANLTWLCSAINSLYILTNFLLKNDSPLPSIDTNFLHTSSDDESIHKARLSCHYLYILTCWWFQMQNKRINLAQFILCRIRNIVVLLCRLPLVNSYNFVPYRVWALGWQPKLSGKFLTQVPPLPIDMLQEIDVLQEYIFRTTLLGWTTRQQFEETWMCFLSVLCTPMDNLALTDMGLALRASSLAIKAITAQLLQTLRFPVLGNKSTSDMIHVPRNTPIPLNSISVKKLKLIQDHIETKFLEVTTEGSSQEIRNVFANRNFERMSNKYSYSQLSIKYFLVSTNDTEENSDSVAELMHGRRKALLEECGLDVNSCLQFLLDYYSQLLKPDSAVKDIRILHETVRSILYISDLFTHKAQFGWMLDTFLNLSKTHSIDDELLHQYLIVGICKAVGVLTPDLEIYEQTKKLLVQFLKSPFLPTRISSLYGILYILEGCLLSNISIGGISEELQLILPCACEYIQVNLNNPTLMQSTEHMMLVWALAFYLMENVEETHMEANFVTTTLHTALKKVLTGKCTDYGDKCIIKGLERLLLMKPLYILEKFGKNLQKLALEKMKDDNPFVSILGVQLLVTYMYVDCWEHLEKPGSETQQSTPDHLVQTIEKISAIFERIKKSFATEVQILCSALPLILKDFFSPSDILTKVIGEFLSPQQPHPKLMSGVVFQVFDSAIQLNQLSLLQDWVVFSLSSFTQSFSNMATWCLTCFFISASPNEWLKAYFPYVQTRVGRYEHEDRKIFCIAGADFYKNLTSDHQRKTFVDSFMKVRDHPDMPFSDLLNSL